MKNELEMKELEEITLIDFSLVTLRYMRNRLLELRDLKTRTQEQRKEILYITETPMKDFNPFKRLEYGTTKQ